MLQSSGQKDKICLNIYHFKDVATYLEASWKFRHIPCNCNIINFPLGPFVLCHSPSISLPIPPPRFHSVLNIRWGKKYHNNNKLVCHCFLNFSIFLDVNSRFISKGFYTTLFFLSVFVASMSHINCICKDCTNVLHKKIAALPCFSLMVLHCRWD